MFISTTADKFSIPTMANTFNRNIKVRPAIATVRPTGPKSKNGRAIISQAKRSKNDPEMLSSTATHPNFINSDKLAKNPALQELNIYEELEIFRGIPPDYSVTFTEDQ